MELITILLLGPCVGLLSSFFGIGGGSLIVSTLYIALPDFEPSSIMGISLSVEFNHKSHPDP